MKKLSWVLEGSALGRPPCRYSSASQHGKTRKSTGRQNSACSQRSECLYSLSNDLQINLRREKEHAEDNSSHPQVVKHADGTHHVNFALNNDNKRHGKTDLLNILPLGVNIWQLPLKLQNNYGWVKYWFYEKSWSSFEWSWFFLLFASVSYTVLNGGTTLLLNLHGKKYIFELELEV